MSSAHTGSGETRDSPTLPHQGGLERCAPNGNQTEHRQRRHGEAR